jgi:protein involved in polysaccharide export with SLBB domain
MDRNTTIPAAWRHRRTRYDPPGLDEAIAAAQGLTDRVESQIEIAAQLSGLPEDEVRSRVLMIRAQSSRKSPGSVPGRQTEVVVVKRRDLRATGPVS